MARAGLEFCPLKGATVFVFVSDKLELELNSCGSPVDTIGPHLSLIISEPGPDIGI